MSWLSQRSVGQKLFAAFMSMLALIGVLGVVAIVKMASLNANVENLAATWLPARAAAGQQLQAVVDQFNLNRQAKRAQTAPIRKSPSRRDRTVNKLSSQFAVSASPRRQRLRDEELIGVGIGHDGFEEF